MRHKIIIVAPAEPGETQEILGAFTSEREAESILTAVGWRFQKIEKPGETRFILRWHPQMLNPSKVEREAQK